MNYLSLNHFYFDLVIAIEHSSTKYSCFLQKKLGCVNSLFLIAPTLQSLSAVFLPVGC